MPQYIVFQIIDNETGEFYVGHSAPTCERHLLTYYKSRERSTCGNIIEKGNYRFEYPEVDPKDIEKVIEKVSELRKNEKCINGIKYAFYKSKNTNMLRCYCGKTISVKWFYGGHANTQFHQENYKKFQEISFL